MSESPISGTDRYIVVVRNLVLLCSIGVRRVERERLQRVRISVELTATPEASHPREDRRRVINYEKIDIYPDAEAVGAVLERTRPA